MTVEEIDQPAGSTTRNFRRTNASRLVELLSLLPHHPVEFYDRATTMIDARLDIWLKPPAYQPGHWEEVLNAMMECLGETVEGFLAEPALAAVESHLRQEIAQVAPHAPFPAVHNGTFTLGRLCYLACRAIKPAILVETGVAFGVSTSYLLAALEVNGSGVLHSIDKPPFGSGVDKFIGALVPERLKPYWRLHRGASQAILPSLLPQLKRVDYFLHDSRHTYRNIHRELRTMTPYLAPRAIVIADDIERNSAFYDWTAQCKPDFWASIQQSEKKSLAGVGVFVGR